MLALFLQCGIFALFAFVGYGLALALVPERDALRQHLGAQGIETRSAGAASLAGTSMSID